MIRLFPTLLAAITLIFMFYDNNADVSAKIATIVLCAITSACYFLIHAKKLYGEENPFFTLSCGWIWALNTGIQGFLLSMILTRVS